VGAHPARGCQGDQAPPGPDVQDAVARAEVRMRQERIAGSGQLRTRMLFLLG
jgi:hypothetical protein